MNLAVDVHYTGDRAVAAGILFADWTADRIAGQHRVALADIQPYVPGRFFERELPCILALLDAIDATPRTIVIDGYATLGPDERDGLGAHLYKALDSKVPVIGVAKTRFAGTPPEAEVLRGRSGNPLFVTSRGVEPGEAKRLIRTMHGANRLPTLLGAVDRLCRSASGSP